MLLAFCIFLLSLPSDYKEKITCPECKGDGYNIAYSSIIYPEYCEECDGKGYVKK
jgi:DnaJ-class molecular chaperone